MKRLLAIPCVIVLLFAAFAAGGAGTGGAHAASTHRAAGRYIVISLDRQWLYAFAGHTLVMGTPVTTGDAALPTPSGRFMVYAKYSPYEFISPWPHGSRFWYPPSRVSFALEFLRGYFIHDAPWRSVFGSGSNAGDVPGTNFGGTHGCVNTPYNAARFLYAWAPLGTPVIIGR